MNVKSFSAILQIALVGAIYVLLAKAGFHFALLVKQVSPVWPPSGFALAAILIGGTRLWPGIMLGAFLANFLTYEPIPVALTIAAGNTLEAIVAATLLRQFTGIHTRLDRVRDVLGLLLWGVCVSPMIAATVGSLSLAAGGITQWTGIQYVWLTWCVGDALGILVVAPAILVWLHRMPRFGSMKRLEAIVLAVVLFTLTVLTLRLSPSHRSTALHYIEFPLLIWAALRFEQRGATLTILLIASIASLLTVQGSGPFAQYSPVINLRLLQAFVIALALTGLVLGAITAERRQLHEEVVAARDAAVEASRAKSLFLANMSHELRTPLTAVIGYSEMLEEGLEEMPTATIRSDVGSIKSAATHLLSLINDILDLSKIEAGKLQIFPERFELLPVLDEVIKTVEPLAQKNSNIVELHADLQPGFSMVADSIRLRQILFNLLSNACKFTHSGLIVLNARVGRQAEQDCVEFSVSDSGIGMSAAQMEQLFQKFQQLDPSFTRRYGGTGLGLAISRYLTQNMGGNLVVQSEPGTGSQFTLRLPTHANS